jgi:hypothetical protein
MFTCLYFTERKRGGGVVTLWLIHIPPQASTPSPSKLSLLLVLLVRRRSSLLTGEETGEEVGEEPNHTGDGEKAGKSSFNILCLRPFIYSGRGESYFTYIQSIFRRGYTVLILYVYLTYKCVYVIWNKYQRWALDIFFIIRYRWFDNFLPVNRRFWAFSCSLVRLIDAFGK